MRYTVSTVVEFEAETDAEAHEYAALLEGARLAYLGEEYDGHDATLRLAPDASPQTCY
jgi:hypothetical protein